MNYYSFTLKFIILLYAKQECHMELIIAQEKVVNGRGFSNIRIRYIIIGVTEKQGNIMFNVQKHEMSCQFWHSTRHLLVFGILDIYPTTT